MRVLGALAIALCVLASTDIDAATITVGKDGEAQYAVLWEAVDAAASGDTVLIGPGVYTELKEQPNDPLGRPVAAVPFVTELAIIGSSPEEVVIESGATGQIGESAPIGIGGTTVASVLVESVTLRGFSVAIVGAGDSLVVRDVVVEGCWNGVTSLVSASTIVEGSHFADCVAEAIGLDNERGQIAATVLGNVVVDCRTGVYSEIQQCRVESNTIEGGRVGVVVTFGGAVDLVNNRFGAIEFVGLAVNQGSYAYVERNHFAVGGLRNISASGTVEGVSNVLRGGSRASIEVSYHANLNLQGNHILNAGDYTVRCSNGAQELATKSLEFNYWGTSDRAQIDEWILDHNDDPEEIDIEIDVGFYFEEPVDEHSGTVGSLKSRLRRP